MQEQLKVEQDNQAAAEQASAAAMDQITALTKEVHDLTEQQISMEATLQQKLKQPTGENAATTGEAKLSQLLQTAQLQVKEHAELLKKEKAARKDAECARAVALAQAATVTKELDVLKAGCIAAGEVAARAEAYVQQDLAAGEQHYAHQVASLTKELETERTEKEVSGLCETVWQ